MKYTDDQIADIGEEIIKELKTIFDPEIPVDIYELGLIYDVQISEEGEVLVIMTLTSPNCNGSGGEGTKRRRREICQNRPHL